MTIKEIVEKCGRNHGRVVLDPNDRYMYVVNKRDQTVKTYLIGIHFNYFLGKYNYTLKDLEES